MIPRAFAAPEGLRPRRRVEPEGVLFGKPLHTFPDHALAWRDQPPNRICSMALTLVIGNKNYSSWSMRPWLAMRASGIAFEEIFIPLYTGEADKRRILDVSKSGKVPALIDGDVTVWDSLAIIEYLTEKFPDAQLWP